jgi:hypothetical protein
MLNNILFLPLYYLYPLFFFSNTALTYFCIGVIFNNHIS